MGVDVKRESSSLLLDLFGLNLLFILKWYRRVIILGDIFLYRHTSLIPRSLTKILVSSSLYYTMHTTNPRIQPIQIEDTDKFGKIYVLSDTTHIEFAIELQNKRSLNI